MQSKKTTDERKHLGMIEEHMVASPEIDNDNIDGKDVEEVAKQVFGEDIECRWGKPIYGRGKKLLIVGPPYAYFYFEVTGKNYKDVRSMLTRLFGRCVMIIRLLAEKKMLDLVNQEKSENDI